MNAQNSSFFSGICVLLIVNAFLITGGNCGGGLLPGILGPNGLVGGLVQGVGLGGLTGSGSNTASQCTGSASNAANQGGGLLNGLLGSGSNMASQCTGSASNTAGSVTNWAGQQSTCSMSSPNAIADAVAKKCNSTSMSCDDCMKKVCDTTCRMTCDPVLVDVSVVILVYVKLLLDLGLLKLVTDLLNNINVNAQIQAALNLIARLSVKL